MTRFSFITSVTVLLLSCSFLLAEADVVIPIDPLVRPIEGEVKTEGDKVMITKADGTTVEMARADVAEIAVGSLKDLYEARYRELGTDDIPGMLALAEWCRRMGIREKWASLVLEVIRLSPDNETAHTELGHIRIGDKWIAPEFGESFGDQHPDNLRPGVFTASEGKLVSVVTDTSAEFAKFACDSLEVWASALRSDVPELPWKRPMKPPVVLVLRDYESYAKAYAESVGGYLVKKGVIPAVDALARPPEYSCYYDPISGNGVAYRFRKTEGCSLRMVMQKALALSTYASCIASVATAEKLTPCLFDGFAEAVGATWVSADGHLRPFAYPQRSRALLERRSSAYTVLSGPVFADMLSYKRSDDFLAFYGVASALVFSSSGSREAFANAVKRDLRGGMKEEELLKMLGDSDGLRASFYTFWTPHWLRLP